MTGNLTQLRNHTSKNNGRSNGLCSNGEVAESEYILVNVCSDATEEKAAWDSYEQYIHRYDPYWKKKTDINEFSAQ